MSDNIYIAVKSAMFQFQGKRVVVKRGRTTVREGHPLLKENPALFTPLAVDFDTSSSPANVRVVEEAADDPDRPRRRGRPMLPRDEAGNIIRGEGEGGNAG